MVFIPISVDGNPHMETEILEIQKVEVPNTWGFTPSYHPFLGFVHMETETMLLPTTRYPLPHGRVTA